MSQVFAVARRRRVGLRRSLIRVQRGLRTRWLRKREGRPDQQSRRGKAATAGPAVPRQQESRLAGRGPLPICLSVPPIIRLSVNIHYGGDDHFLSDNGVNQGVGELFNKAAMKCVVQRGLSLWKFQDALYRGLTLFRESQSETRLLKFVVFDAVEQLFLRRLSEVMCHFRNLSLISRNTASPGMVCVLPERISASRL